MFGLRLRKTFDSSYDKTASPVAGLGTWDSAPDAQLTALSDCDSAQDHLRFAATLSWGFRRLIGVFRAGDGNLLAVFQRVGGINYDGVLRFNTLEHFDAVA